MTTAFIDLVSEPVAALFVELVVVVFRVHGSHGSAGLRDAAFGVGQQPRADVPALRFGQHREPRDDVSPGLVGMVGVRIEPASRHGAILVGLAGLNRRGGLRGQAGAIGRIDRIGSRNAQIQLVNFWPDMDLDEYINLKGRVETRMKISVMTSTGDDDLINPEEKGDLEYRRAQLKKLQNEVVDLEDMSTGISIMDLGLNEFRLDLLEYVKHHDDLDKKPFGLHAVAPANSEMPEGVIFVLKNRNNGVNIDSLNRIHPFYMVYIGVDGEIICDYLNPKKLLDNMRLLCRGKSEPIKELYTKFNEETDDGRDMAEMSELLSDAINSIIDTKEESDIDSLFKAGGTSALLSAVSGIDDFELICFLVVK